MKSAAYWKNRFTAVEAMQNAKASQAVQEITPAFDRAEAEIQKQIDSWYSRFAVNNQVSLADAKKLLNDKQLKELKWDIEEYIKYGQQNAIDGSWMKELENASAKYHISRLEALKIRTQQAAERAFGNESDVLDQLLVSSFTDDYYRTAYEIQKGMGIGFDVAQINQSRLDKVLKKPWTSDGFTFSDRIWKSKKQLIDAVDKSITQMCILGGKPDAAIDQITKAMGVSRSQAGRLVMTESAYFASEAQKQCFEDLDVEMFEVVATLDTRTSDICQQMDGKTFKMSEYEVGVTAPPFHPWCRSTTAPYFDDEWGKSGSRAAKDEDGKTYQVPADMKYKDWEKAFVQGDKSNVQPVQTVQKKKEPSASEKAFNGQVDLLKKYGNVTNMMLMGTSEDMQQWSELQKVSGKDEKAILKEMSKSADNWETVLGIQDDKFMEQFSEQLWDIANDEELAALNLWTGETYALINRHMRYGDYVDDISRNASHTIHSVLGKIVTHEELIVHRGTGIKEIFEK